MRGEKRGVEEETGTEFFEVQFWEVRVVVTVEVAIEPGRFLKLKEETVETGKFFVWKVDQEATGDVVEHFWQCDGVAVSH
jgi:hypothetical protein